MGEFDHQNFYYTKEGEVAAVLEFENRIEENPILGFVDQLYAQFPDSRAVLVGGSVRDAILGMPNKDYDLVVEGIELDDLIPALEKMGTVTSVRSRAYGVVYFRAHGSDENIEIVLPRREEYEEGKRASHAKVEIGGLGIEEDFLRRDFTINAIGYEMRRRNLIDPVGGLSDIREKKIRAVGEAHDRFNEDPTRILRGIRFAAKYGFEIDEATWQAMDDMKGEIRNKFLNDAGVLVERVANEKIGEEMVKTIAADPSKFFELWEKLGLLDILLPEISELRGVPQPPEFHSEGDVFEHTKMVLENIDRKASSMAKLAALLHDTGKPETLKYSQDGGERISFHGHELESSKKAAQILQRLRLKGKQQEKVKWLIENHMKIYNFPVMKLSKQKEMAMNPNFSDLVYLAEADARASIKPDGGVNLEFIDSINSVLAQIKEEEEAGRPQMIISGSDVVQAFKDEGATGEFFRLRGSSIGKVLEEVNTRFAEHKIETKEEAMELTYKLAREAYEKEGIK